jgi:mRNA interferase HigB
MEAAARHARSVASVERWYTVVSAADATNLMQLRASFADVDQVGNSLVFNVGGNNYRLVCCVHWPGCRLFFRALLTHAEYDRMNVEALCPE